MTKRITQHAHWNEQTVRARAMRHEPTRAEDLLWQQIRGRRLDGLKFRRQHPIGRFIVDFYCVEAGVAIEVDGGMHASQREEDVGRQQFLEDREVRFVRFTNAQVTDGMPEVLHAIAQACKNPSPRRGEGQG
jgi:very-short-patch-repair endonuclease